MLVDRVVCCWLATVHAELLLQQAQYRSDAHIAHCERQLDRASRRFSFAARQLQLFNKLLADAPATTGRSFKPARPSS